MDSDSLGDGHALHQSEDLFRAIARDTPFLICHFLPSGEITFANDAYCSYFEQKSSELVGQSFLSLIPEAERETVLTSITELTAESPMQSHEHRVIAPGGEIRWQRWTNRALFNGQGLATAFQSLGEDVTDRREAEERALRFSHLLESSLNEIYVFDAETLQFVTVNRGARENLGYSMDELRSLTPLALKPEHSVESFAKLLEPLRAGTEEKIEFAAVHRRKDGTLYPVEVHLQMMTDSFPVFVAMILDITGRKQAEEALRQSERVLLESQVVARLGSYVLDVPSGVWESSPIMDQIFGIGDDFDRTVDGWATLLHPDDRQPLTQYLARDVLERHGRFDREYRIVRHDDGVERWVHGLGKLEFDSGGRPLRFAGTIQDITDRKRAEEERERLSVAIDQAAEIIMITDSDGLIQYVNPAFERVTGYRPEEVLGQNPRVLKSGQHDDGFYRDMWVTLQRGDAWRGRIVNKRKDGSLYTEETVISPVREASGRTVHYVAVKRDITEELKLEEQFLQAQKMESVGRLAGGVAHDFNNMLGVILGNVEMALEEVDPAGSLHGNLTEICAAAERSADLTRQLLAFARKQTIAPKVLDLNETVGKMVQMLRRLIGEDIDLLWRPGTEVPPIRVDPSQIDQILANLCVNARDAIEGVGRVTIKTGGASFDGTHCVDHPGFIPGDFTRLTVSDDGCGMDRKTLDRIFEPFFTTKSTGEGTGLGLATIYGIVQQNLGFINVRSEPGQGTTFEIYLPRFRT